MTFNTIIIYVLGITAIIGLIFAIQRLFRKIKPISCHPSWQMGEDDILGAKVVNHSNETQYIVSCDAIGTYSLKSIILKHITHPFIHPRFYRTFWSGTHRLPLINEDSPPIKIESHDIKSFERQMLGANFFNYLDRPLFLIETTLSSGRKFRSRAMPLPNDWHILTFIDRERELGKLPTNKERKERELKHFGKTDT